MAESEYKSQYALDEEILNEISEHPKVPDTYREFAIKLASAFREAQERQDAAFGESDDIFQNARAKFLMSIYFCRFFEELGFLETEWSEVALESAQQFAVLAVKTGEPAKHFESIAKALKSGKMIRHTVESNKLKVARALVRILRREKRLPNNRAEIELEIKGPITPQVIGRALKDLGLEGWFKG